MVRFSPDSESLVIVLYNEMQVFTDTSDECDSRLVKVFRIASVAHLDMAGSLSRRLVRALRTGVASVNRASGNYIERTRRQDTLGVVQCGWQHDCIRCETAEDTPPPMFPPCAFGAKSTLSTVGTRLRWVSGIMSVGWFLALSPHSFSR
jgi:hypothetical protein